jgi:molybdopterin molybdotransferase
MKIMTGAPLPVGADAVVAVEFAETSVNGNLVKFREAVPVGKAIAQPGSDITRGAIVLEKGARLGPAQIAVAASIGAATVSVFAPPRVAVLGTGDEIVGFDETPGPTQLRSSNNPMLTTLLRGFGCMVRDLGIYVDDPHHIAIAIEEGLRGDVLFITGGMSMGDRDFVPGILRDMGGELLITKLRIRPGKPFVLARMRGGKFVFGLPGNPVSAFVCASRLARRLLDRMAGAPASDPLKTAALTESLGPNGPREFYQPGILQLREGKSHVQPLQWKGSADIYTLARANALIVRPVDQSAQKASAEIWVMEI